MPDEYDLNSPHEAFAQRRIQYLEGQAARSAPGPMPAPDTMGPAAPAGSGRAVSPDIAASVGHFAPIPGIFGKMTGTPEERQQVGREALVMGGELGGMTLGGASPVPGGAAVGAGAGAVAGQRAADALFGGGPADPGGRDVSEFARAAGTTAIAGRVGALAEGLFNVAKGVAGSIRSAAPAASAAARGAPATAEVTQGIAEAQQAVQQDAFDQFNRLVTKVGEPAGAATVPLRTAAQAGQEFQTTVVPHIAKVTEAIKAADAAAGPTINAAPMKEAAKSILDGAPAGAIGPDGRKILEEIANTPADKVAPSYVIGARLGLQRAVQGGDTSSALTGGLSEFDKASWLAIANSKNEAVGALRDTYKEYLKASSQFEKNAVKAGVTKEGTPKSASEVKMAIDRADTPALISELKASLAPADAQMLSADYLQKGMQATIKDGKIDPTALRRFVNKPETEAWMQGAGTHIDDLKEIAALLPEARAHLSPPMTKLAEANAITPRMSDQEKMAALSRIFQNGVQAGHTPQEIAGSIMAQNFGPISQSVGALRYIKNILTGGGPGAAATSGAALVGEEALLQ